MREEPAGERTRIRSGHRYCHQRVWVPIDPDEGADDTDWCSLEVWTPVSSLSSLCDVEEKHIIKEGMKVPKNSCFFPLFLVFMKNILMSYLTVKFSSLI